VNEIHAAVQNDNELQHLLGQFSQAGISASLPMLDKQADVTGTSRQEIYARVSIETVKIGMKRFRQAQGIGNKVGNVEVIVDANDLNTHSGFIDVIENAQAHDGLFKGINRVIPLESAASRVLRLADVVAYSRSWVANAELNAKGLGEACNIELL